MADIKKNISEIQEKIAVAAVKSGRNPSDITLMAVTKTIEPVQIKEAIDCGILDLGENKVQEMLRKYEVLPEECRWHLIGHLQTNKVKYIIDKVQMIHSVDSEKLALEINNRAEKIGKTVDILLEVNIAEEDTKFGLKYDEVEGIVKKIGLMTYLRLRGLMAVAPNVDDPEKNRKYFRKMRKLFIDIKGKTVDNVDMYYLSMGMTNDYEIAIEEGANIVRVGTGIFGERTYN